MGYALGLTTPPASEPVTLAQMKAFLRVEHDDEDEVIAADLSAARAWVEERTGKQLVTATHTLTLDAFPSESFLYLPRGPHQSVEVTYLDADGDEQTFDPANYGLHADRAPPELRLVSGASWPATSGEAGCVTIEMVCGFGDGDDVPGPILRAIKQLAATWFKFRENILAGGSPQDVPQNIEWMLANYCNSYSVSQVFAQLEGLGSPCTPGC